MFIVLYIYLYYIYIYIEYILFIYTAFIIKGSLRLMSKTDNILNMFDVKDHLVDAF